MKPTIFFAMLMLLAGANAQLVRSPGLRLDKQTAGAESARASSYETNSDQAFSTCANSSSTGVARPKMVTDTRSLLLS